MADWVANIRNAVPAWRVCGASGSNYNPSMRVPMTVSSERTLLLVDDEQNITASLVRVLRGDGYKVFTAPSAEHAFAVLEGQHICVVMTDQRMPEMNGTEFLSRVKDKYPDTVRMVLSGHADLAVITDAVNRGCIYKFLTKPWDNEILRANIHEAFQHYELVQEKHRLQRDMERVNADLRKANEELAAMLAEKSRLAITDELTGIFNRRRFDQALEAELNRGERFRLPTALILFDIDHFKQINDTHGHQAGDAVLVHLARLVSGKIRLYDVFARWGGEEFVILIPSSEMEGAAALAERLRVAIEEGAFPYGVQVTCSFGVAGCVQGDTAGAVVKKADAALYRAKQSGRNCVERGY